MSKEELIKAMESLVINNASTHDIQVSVGLHKDGHIEILIEDEVKS